MHRLPHLAVLMLVTGIALAQTTEPAVRPEEPVKDQTPQPRFDVLEYQVEGNSVLSDIAIENAVKASLGYDRGIADVEKAREALEKAYQNAGYLTVLVDIPEQDVKGGIVRLVVIEASVQRLRVTGSRYYSLGRIKAQAPSLEPGTVPYFPDVQKDLSGLNRYPDRKVTPVLKPGRTPGTVQVDLKVEDKFPLHGNVELNDRYSGDTSRTRLGTMLRYDNLWQREHSLTLNAQVAPEDLDESEVLSLSYLFRLPGQDDLMALYAVRSRSNVAAVGDLSVIGNGDIHGARYIVPLRGRENFFHSLTLGIDRKDFLESVVLQGADALNTPISYTPIVVEYSSTRQSKNGIVEFGAGTTIGLRNVLGNNEQEFADKRFKASASYLALRLHAGSTRKLPGGFTLAGEIDSQFASGPLISSEQFGAGGQDGVRGYRESEALGDDGLRASVELRRPFPSSWAGKNFDEFYALGFVEAAVLRIQEPLPQQTDEFNLLGAGVGLRAKLRKRFRLGLDIAHAFEAAAYTRKGERRAHFSAVYEF